MSIHRHVYIRLRPEARTGPEFDTLRAAAEALRSLPEVVAMGLLTPADAGAAAAWDLCLQLEFACLQDVQTYRDRPAHRHFVDVLLAPQLLVLKAWNFEGG